MPQHFPSSCRRFQTAGSALDEDIRNDLSLLREELEMLKRAFRRHCADTASD